MTARPLPMGDEPFTTDPERALDAYAEATRIAASGALVRRFQAGVAQERAQQRGVRGRVRALAARAGWRTSLPLSASPRAGATFALRLQGLALLLLLVLAMGLVAGGAGAAIMTLLDGTGRRSQGPAEILLRQPSPVLPPSPAPVPASTSTPTPTLRVQPMAQHDPARRRAADRRPARHDRAQRQDRAARHDPTTHHDARSGSAAAVCRALVHPAPAAGDTPAPDMARPHAGRRTCAF